LKQGLTYGFTGPSVLRFTIERDRGETAMKAALLVEPGKIVIREVPTPVPGEGDVLIKIFLAGVCGTDYALYSGEIGGPLPLIPGHEAVGQVAALGSGVKSLAVGQHVTFQPNFPCGKCEPCQEGRDNVCLRKVRLGLDVHGVFAEYVAVPHSFVWPLPEGLPYQTAVFAEPLAVALHGVKRGPTRPGERVLVYGTGIIGLLSLQLALLRGGQVAAFDISEPRLAIAKKLGATQIFSSAAELEKRGGSFHVIYETSGTPEALARAVKLCAPAGLIVMTGLPATDFPVPTVQIVRKELSILGSMIYTDEFPEVLQLLRGQKINIEPLRSTTYPLEDAARAFGEFRSPGRIKSLIRMD
jgi:2-desacetyl-2-hydroxyethyl bacteriochlorophyllide A dehydrogenase